METANDETTVLAERRPANSRLYPWYDSIWLSKYAEAKAIIQRVRPDLLATFVEALRIFHTRPDFQVEHLERPFDDATFGEISRVASTLQPMDLELHETGAFGRLVTHDHPVLTEIQKRTVPFVSELVGEPVEAAYNFLSLYRAKGVCSVHLDAPEAKWTLDLCVDQSSPWPIFFSEVQPWPDSVEASWNGEDWENEIKRSKSLKFTSHTLLPGQAVVFSGSSQWHYRDPMPETSGPQFCTLLFFHFIPEGTGELVRPKNWSKIFGIPELGALEEARSS